MDNKSDVKWEPKEPLLKVMLSMGINKNDAEEALFCTGNESVELAVSYLFGRNVQDDEITCKSPDLCDGEETDASIGSNKDEDNLKDYKMVFVVNTSLKMGLGKLAAQVAHACLGLYRHMLEEEIMVVELYQWQFDGEKKVVLKGNDHMQLQELYEKALDMSLPCYLIRDAGKTQIAPNSVTVLSIFGLDEEVNKLTGTLSLL